MERWHGILRRSPDGIGAHDSGWDQDRGQGEGEWND
jgi:hypothetical protein